jgi:lysozyme family protein
MQENREAAFEFLLKDEPGFEFDPCFADTGKKYGISLALLRAVTGKAGLKLEDLKELELDEAREIWLKEFWEPAHADSLPAGLDYFLFDSAVTAGLHVAVRWLEFAAALQPDGVLNREDKQVIGSSRVASILDEMERIRRRYWRSTRAWQINSSEITNRINRSKMRAKKLAGLK